jgi:hypothetical protein
MLLAVEEAVVVVTLGHSHVDALMIAVVMMTAHAREIVAARMTAAMIATAVMTVTAAMIVCARRTAVTTVGMVVDAKMIADIAV